MSNPIRTAGRLFEAKEVIEEALLASVRTLSGPAHLKEAMSYSLLAGGKRLRPLLMLAAADLHGMVWERVLPFAVSLEMIHTYSLIHDDLPAMDNDDLRRGKPTNHVVFGEAMAILAGDALLTEAFVSLGASLQKEPQGAKALAYLGKAAGTSGMIGGQVMDLSATSRKISLEELKILHARKTGALIQAAVLLPAILHDAPAEEIAFLEAFSSDLGLLFQIQDDCLDETSDEITLGKTCGKDARDKKSTFVSLLGLSEALAYRATLSERLCGSLSSFGEEAALLREVTEAIIGRTH